MMHRRRFLLTSLAGVLTVPVAVEAQQPGKHYRIGYLETGTLRPRPWEAFRERLRDLGYIEAQTVTYEARWADGQLDRLRKLAAELVRLNVDVVVTAGSPATEAAKHATITIPIVMATRGDPVGLGLVASLARPGGNVTGLTTLSRELSGKRATSPLFFGHRRQLADLALKHRLPTIFAFREYAEAGGLMAYGPSYTELFQRAAEYVDKILKGARPADLPVEQPTKFELVVNLKTAKALGITIPPSLLLRADQVIE